MPIRRRSRWDGGRDPEVSRMWAERQVADLDIRELAREARITPAAWWGVESGEYVADDDTFNRMREIVRRRYLERRRST